MGHPYDILAPVLLDAFCKDRNLSELTNLTINHNSERIYNPNSKYSLLGFIFGHQKGRPSRITAYLKDTTLRKNKEIQFGQYDPEEIESENTDSISRCDLRKNKQWKKNSKWQNIPEDIKKKILAKLSFLPSKQYIAVEKRINGFGNLTANERQNISKARKKINAKRLNIDI